MTDAEFKTLVREMRHAQITYYKTPRVEADKKQEYLILSKQLESKVDKELNNQTEMFKP